MTGSPNPSHAASPSVAPDSQALLALLRRRHDLFAQILQLSGSQWVQDNPDDDNASLGAVMARRQELIDELATLDRQLDPERIGLTTRWPRLSPDEVNQADDLIHNTRRLHDQVFEADGQMRAALTAARDRLGAQLQQMSVNQNARHAYRTTGTSAPDPRFTDRQG